MAHTQFEILSHPGDGADVTPHDSNDLATPGVLFVGTGGDVAIHTLAGTELVFKNVANGSFLPVIAKRVLDTGTDADDIIVLFGFGEG